MIFTTPLGLLALLAIPAIVAIHLFRRRFPPRPVAGLFLWQTARQTPQEGRTVDRLPITASLILECLAALALALILAGARLSSAGTTKHLVVLLDDSASMAASDARAESPRDRGVRRVLAEVDRLGSGARVTLVKSGERPAVLLGPAAYAVEARPALDRWTPDGVHHSLPHHPHRTSDHDGRIGEGPGLWSGKNDRARLEQADERRRDEFADVYQSRNGNWPDSRNRGLHGTRAGAWQECRQAG